MDEEKSHSKAFGSINAVIATQQKHLDSEAKAPTVNIIQEESEKGQLGKILGVSSVHPYMLITKRYLSPNIYFVIHFSLFLLVGL